MNQEAEDEVTVSSGNVFADLGLPNAEERDAKVRLGVAINNILERDGLTQAAVASMLGSTNLRSLHW